MNTQSLTPVLRILLACLLLASPVQAGHTRPAPTTDVPAPGVSDSHPTARVSVSDQNSSSSDENTPPPEDGSAKESTPDSGQSDFDADPAEQGSHHFRHNSHNDALVAIGHDAMLASGRHADSVVAVFGNATSDGEVEDSVVAVIGKARVTGTVRDSVVAVMGSVYVNGRIEGDVVAVLGNMELGPQAEINGDVVVVGGTLTRDPQAVVRGGIREVLGGALGDFDWIRPWFERCVLYGRPLAFAPGLGWAWELALAILALYALLALVFHRGVDQCVKTFEDHPGQCVLSSLLVILLVPAAFLVLIITILGIAAIPFLALGLLGAAMFGKVVLLASIGRRCTPFLADNPVAHTVVGVLVGGAIVLVLYTIPIIGFVLYKALELLSLGIVFYTVLLAIRGHRQARAQAAGAGGPGGGPAGGGVGGSTAGATMSAGAGFAGATPDGMSGAGSGSTTDFAGSTGSGNASGPANASGPSSATASASGAPSLSAATAPRAGFWIRMAALLLDIIIVGVIVHQVAGWPDMELIVLAAYGAVMWKLKGSTVGGIIFGLQVVRLDGRPVDWSTAIVRALSCFLSLVVVGLGFLWIAMDPESQAWHDKIAGTVVVRAPKGASLL